MKKKNSVCSISEKITCFLYSQTCVQRPPLGPEKCGRYAEGCLRFRLIIVTLGWSVLTGGR